MTAGSGNFFAVKSQSRKKSNRVRDFFIKILDKRGNLWYIISNTQ